MLDGVSEKDDSSASAALAVLAGIAASDAICGLSLGQYSRAQSHGHSVTLLRTARTRDTSLPLKLQRLLASKDRAHYSPAFMSAGDAAQLVRQARSLVRAASSL